jgi:drug/metabolite transporter (DMT)-like permease
MSKTFINVALLVLSIGLAVAGQLSMKAGMNKVGEIKSEDLKHPVDLIVRVVKSAWAVIGVLLYAISAVFWLVVLSRVNLSVAYPIVAVGYVVVVLYSWLVFKEPVKWFTWIGLAFIVMGVVITAQGLKSETPNESNSLRAPAAQAAAASGDLSVNNETGLGNTD